MSGEQETSCPNCGGTMEQWRADDAVVLPLTAEIRRALKARSAPRWQVRHFLSLIPPLLGTFVYFGQAPVLDRIFRQLPREVVIAWGFAGGLVVLLVFWANDWWRLARDIHAGTFMRRSGDTEAVEEPTFPGPWNLRPEEVLYMGERRYPVVLPTRAIAEGHRWLSVDHTRSGFVIEVRDREGHVVYRDSAYRPEHDF
jgi:hypothetical protein